MVKSILRYVLGLFLLLQSVPFFAAEGGVSKLVESSGFKEGVLVIAGGSLFNTEEAVILSQRFVIHCLDNDAERVKKNRKIIQSKGVYGQVVVEYWNSKELPYQDNLVNILVSDGSINISKEEALRVLRPGGKYTGSKEAETKPWPLGVDQWTHQWYRPHGNLLSNDRVADIATGPQWIMAPSIVVGKERFGGTRSLITEAGRVFFVTVNEESNLANPMGQYYLIARDAFNGVFLWKRVWEGSSKEGRDTAAPITAVSSPKIVAEKEKLYVAERKEVLELSASTGEVLKRFPPEGVPQALLFEEGRLAIESDKGVELLDPETGKRVWFYKTKGIPNEAKAEKPRQQWRLDTPGIISTMISHKRVTFLERCRNKDGQGQHDEVVCLDFNTGKELWRKSLEDVTVMSPRRSIKIAFIREKVIGLVDENVFTVLSTADGRELWSQKPGNSSKWWTYHRFAGHFFKDDQIWLHMKDTSYDMESQEYWSVFEAETGKLVRDFVSKGRWSRTDNPGKEGCSSVVAFERFLLYPRLTTYIDFKTGEKKHFNFYRGSCVLGSIPANGMFYTPPEACGCFSEALRGFIAAVARPGVELLSQPKPEERLIKGPAWKSEAPSALSVENAWPQYRSDAARSSSTSGSLPVELKELWSVPLTANTLTRSGLEWGLKLGGEISAPVIAEGKAFVTVPDAHQLIALDAKTGAKLWEFTADGRIDTPPSIYKGLCLFGSHDGKVYCLRVSDGALVWSFLAAPNERRMIAYGQFESLWPVSGSVLIHSGLVFASAGRSIEADGGIFVSALEPATGKLVWTKNIKEGNGNQTDIITSDEKSLYLAGNEIDPLTGATKAMYEVDPSKGIATNLKAARRFLTSSHYGLTDNTWTRIELAPRRDMQTWGYGGSTGLMLAFSKGGTVTYTMKPNQVLFVGKDKDNSKWKNVFSGTMLVSAMAITSDALLAAGSKEKQRLTDKNGFLGVYSIKDGKQLNELDLPASPVYDGLASAYDKLYVSTSDGKLSCFGKK